VPAVVTRATPVGTAYVGDFAGASRLYSREASRIDWSEGVYDATAGASDFERNLVRFRCELRMGGPAWLKPAAFAEVALTA
jgi:hypothetical protein